MRIHKHLSIIAVATLVAATAMMTTGCQSEASKAENLMEEIRENYEAGRYELCLKGIDSLRATYPKAVEARKEALVIYQDASLKLAQDHLAKVDQDLIAAQQRYDSLEMAVGMHRSEGTATAEELRDLNLQKVLRDSLQGVFDMECSKIKYIHKKQKEE